MRRERKKILSCKYRAWQLKCTEYIQQLVYSTSFCKTW